jgi:hypothetical protein
MADEREEARARERHARALAELRDLRGDLEARMVSIIRDQDNRQMDDLREESAQRSWMRGELASLQRRVDAAIDVLR